MSAREATLKKLRAKARKEQTTFTTAVQSANLPPWQAEAILSPSKHKSKKTRTNVAMDTDSDNYIDKLTPTMYAEAPPNSKDHWWSPEPPKSDKPMTISDVEIRPAKPRGIRKEYDWVEKPKSVIAMDDDLKSVFSEEDWEEIVAEQESLFRRAYSAVASTSNG